MKKVQKLVFPLNYLKSTLTPAKIFLGRKQLSWLKIFFVILFLNGLLLLPLVTDHSRSDSFKVESTFPTVFSMVDQETADALDQASMQNGQMVFPEPFLIEKPQGAVAGGWEEEEIQELLKQKKNILAFSKTDLYLKEGDLPISKVPYTKDLRLSGWLNPTEVKGEIERQWYQYNRVFITASYSFIIAAILLVMNLLLIFGASFFMFLAGRGSWINIASYQESTNLILNAIGIPVLAALLTGFIVPDISIMMSIQTFGLVIMLVLIYFRTQFSEQYLMKETVQNT